MLLTDYLDRARDRGGIPSDNRLAAVLGVHQTSVVSYRRGTAIPTPGRMVKLAELAAASRAAEAQAAQHEREAADCAARATRLRAALEARRTAAARRRIEIARAILAAASTAEAAAAAGVSRRTVERVRAELVAQLASLPARAERQQQGQGREAAADP